MLVPIPETLLIHPCEPVGPGKTLNSLSAAYVKNTSCIAKYRGVLSGIIQYNKSITSTTSGENKKDGK